MITTITSRRASLAAVAAALTCLARRPGPEPPPEPDGPSVAYWSDPGEDLPGQAVEVWSNIQWERLPAAARPADARRLPVVGWFRLRPVPRWEALADDQAPPPEPLDVAVIRFGKTPSVVARHWRPSDAERCKLCQSCNAAPSAVRPGEVVCMRFGPPTITEAEAATIGDGFDYRTAGA